MNKIQNLIIRYITILLISYPNLYLFYLIFTPLTIYSSYFLLKIFFNATLLDKTILIKGSLIKFIDACIAGSAYYLLTFLNLSTPKIKSRIKILLISFLAFFSLNILRIFILSIMLISKSEFFDITHKLFWFLGSTVFVIGIWFAEVKIFKIKGIPFYSDFKYLKKQIKWR